jgi:tRNA1Val (adenine37-N6)-methyltransferase
MPNDHFEFKQFKVKQPGCAQKVSTDACLFGAWVASRAGTFRIGLDIGTGTGLLMLMLAQKHDAEIEGIEIEESCAVQARENLEASPWKNRLSVLKADVKSYQFEKKYDLVISNPPFYENQLRSPDPSKNLAWHSHELNLAELAAVASGLLSANGILCILLPWSRKDELLSLAAHHSLHPVRILTVKHTRDHQPGRCMVMLSERKGDVVEESLEIRNEDGSYSNAFIELLGDYYLFL